MVNSTVEAEPSSGLFHVAGAEFQGSTSDLDRDIVVLVGCEDPHKSVVFAEQGEDSTVLMLSLVPKLEVNNDAN